VSRRRRRRKKIRRVAGPAEIFGRRRRRISTFYLEQNHWGKTDLN